MHVTRVHSWKKSYLLSFFLSLVTGTLLTGTKSASSGTSITQLLESATLLLLSLDGTSLLTGCNLLNGKNSTLDLGNTRDIGGITVLGLTGLAGEDNQLSLVGLEALNIELKRLLRLVAATVVNRDTNGKGLLAVDTSLLLNFFQVCAHTFNYQDQKSLHHNIALSLPWAPQGWSHDQLWAWCCTWW